MSERKSHPAAKVAALVLILGGMTGCLAAGGDGAAGVGGGLAVVAGFALFVGARLFE